MKALLRAAVAALTLLPGTASAEIVPATPFFLDLGATGFGDAHRLLTLQTTPLEVGGTVDVGAGTTSLTGDAISGADKSKVYSAQALNWLTGANVGIGLDTNETGSTTGLAVNAIDLTLYGNTGVAIQTFSLASPFTIGQALLVQQQGNGNSVFNFGLNAAEQAQFTADIIAHGGAGAVFVGLDASLGCASALLSCEANDGADSFLAFNQAAPAAVPLPAMAWVFGPAFAGMWTLAMRRRKVRPV